VKSTGGTQRQPMFDDHDATLAGPAVFFVGSPTASPAHFSPALNPPPYFFKNPVPPPAIETKIGRHLFKTLTVPSSGFKQQQTHQNQPPPAKPDSTISDGGCQHVRTAPYSGFRRCLSSAEFLNGGVTTTDGTWLRPIEAHCWRQQESNPPLNRSINVTDVEQRDGAMWISLLCVRQHNAGFRHCPRTLSRFCESAAHRVHSRSLHRIFGSGQHL
jgi:hypothetical protein